MIAIIVSLILLILALLTVSRINAIQKQRRRKRLKMRRLQREADNLDEVIRGLEETIPNRVIIRYINDELVDVLEEMAGLSDETNIGVRMALDQARQKTESLIEADTPLYANYRKDNDADIARAHYHLGETAHILKKRCALGKLPEEELRIYLAELTWGDLLIEVQSLIAQGYKARLRGNLPGTFAYYQTAQNKLMESTHPNPKRLKMIREMGELLMGSQEKPGTDLTGENFIPPGS